MEGGKRIHVRVEKAEELYWLQEMHYDCCFGVYPGLMLPDELMHVTTRIIYTYIRLHPKVPFLSYLLLPSSFSASPLL